MSGEVSAFRMATDNKSYLVSSLGRVGMEYEAGRGRETDGRDLEIRRLGVAEDTPKGNVSLRSGLGGG